MEELSVQACRLWSHQLRADADVPVTDCLTAMSASAVSGLQHEQPLPGYGKSVSLNIGAVGDGQPEAVSHDGLLTLTGTNWNGKCRWYE